MNTTAYERWLAASFLPLERRRKRKRGGPK